MPNPADMDSPSTARGGFAASVGGPVIFTLGVRTKEFVLTMSNAIELSALLASQPKPVCANLTPFEIADADFEAGFVALRFAEQPAFSNHWGNIQGGFGVAWCPTVEIKSSFVAPAKLGECRGEARIIKAGKALAFVEARLWGADGQLAIHATATVSVKV